MPKVSIIVPVYKVENYIQRCVESLRNQTLADIEIILVDDGSPDRCPEICDALALQDSRIRVIHKENGGVSSARNAGLDAATGNYIAFVDSDDYIDPDMYEKMLVVALEHNCDVVMCDCLKEYPENSLLYTHLIRPGYYSTDQLLTEYYPHLLMMENVEYPATISSCTLLWNRRMNTPDMRYETGIRYSEDLLFGAKLMRRASSFYYMKGEPFYHYVTNAQSATHTFVPDKFQDYKKLHKKIRNVFSGDLDFDFSRQIDFCLLFFVYNAVGDLYSAPLTRFQKKQMILQILRDPSVKELFRRLSLLSLPVSPKQKLITLLYRSRIGISPLIKYYER